jgi:hypothetical protein
MNGKQIALLIVAVLAASAAVAIGLLNRNAGELPDQYTAPGVCLACETEQVARYEAGEIAPWDCQQCDEQAVFPWYYCYKSGMLFVPAPIVGDEGNIRIPPFPRSPITGGDDIGLYVEGTPGMEPEGRAPLPPWPPGNAAPR